MTERYDIAFTRIRSEHRIGFIPFAVAGDPDTTLSEAVFKTYIDAGADILEIGYPFSDPVADGPINQRAAMRAIQSGLNHARFFSLIKHLRSYSDIPFGVLLYANSLYYPGYDDFCRRAADAGIDSLLVADMPPEESTNLYALMRTHGLAVVHIVSELTGRDRIKAICRSVDGFIYVVSRLGPTGTDSGFSSGVASTITAIRPHTTRPLCVGFGISTPEHVRQIAASGADGAIVGSALVKVIESTHDKPKTMLATLARRVRELKKATAHR